MTTAELVDFFEKHFPLGSGRECRCGWAYDGNPKHSHSHHMAGLMRCERGRDLLAFKKAISGGVE